MSEGDTPDGRRPQERRVGDERQGTGGQGTGGTVAPFPARRSTPQPPDARAPDAKPQAGTAVVSFDRHELREIFNLYGRRVAEGEWRDYAIDFRPDKAVFSIYRRASEVPLYRVEKDPALARRQGAYAVVAATGLILKRGPDLARVLQSLDKKPKLVVV